MSDRGRDQPFVPAVGDLYWVQTTILPPGDPEEQRVVAVLAAPATVDGTVAIAHRAGADRFTRRVPVQCRLWTEANVAPAGRLDDTSLAALQDEYGM